MQPPVATDASAPVMSVKIGLSTMSINNGFSFFPLAHVSSAHEFAVRTSPLVLLRVPAT
jgi:hypothetical protein